MKLVTFNIANYNDHGDWDQRVQMIAQDLIDLDADVVGLQEVRFDPTQESTQTSYQNMGEEVLAAIHDNPEGQNWAGTAIVTQPAMYYPIQNGQQNPWRYPDVETGAFWEGLTILSRPGIVETGTLFLSKNNSCGDNNRRSTQFAAVPDSDSVLYFFNAHFSYDQACLTDNVSETLAYMQRFGTPQMLVGDFNATPDNSALQALRDAGFVDLWVQLHSDEDGYTYAAGDATKRIDYCWASADVAARVTSIERIGTKPNSNGVYASDHYGLCVVLDP